MRYREIDFYHLLERVDKPGRYTDNEVNCYRKLPESDKVTFCLAYPDVYEVGFSHQGLKLLYVILNEEFDAMADRVYAPWRDMADLLKEENLPLFALESKAAVRDFDVLGFTLQSELTYTNILYILELAGISIISGQRGEAEPIIIAGGPCAGNPEPLSDFIDAFLIGDGEEAILEIKNCIKSNKHKSRSQRIQALGEIGGVYTPQYYDATRGRIRIRKYLDFDKASHSKGQIIPWLQPTHDRFACEIMRGCSRGCRFCYAGYFYRPVREKSAEVIKSQIKREVSGSGWEEVALTSLSSSDYSCIRTLLFQLSEFTECNNTKLSLPSLRVDSLDERLTSLMNDMQQKSITIAPEAGSQRLRDIINKNMSEAEILEGIRVAVQNNWRVLKLYFMIGLPFEEWSDIEAILILLEKIVTVTGRKLQINITISPFVPKAFTPFQWAAASSRDELLEKVWYLKNYLRKYKFIKLKYHTLEYQALECLLGRGDRSAGELLYAAYRQGAVYDGWDELFDYSAWQRAEETSGMKIADYLGEIDKAEILPWDKIDLGIDKEFLLREYEKAQDGLITPDCREKCTACGLCDSEITPVYQYKIEDEILSKSNKPESSTVAEKSFRVFYEKEMEVRYIGHLDMLRMTYRLVRASGLPVAYSEGYNRHPQVSFGPPLPLGMTSKCEYFDLKLGDNGLCAETVQEKLEKVFPAGMKITHVQAEVTKTMRSMQYYREEEISLSVPHKMIDFFSSRIEKFDSSLDWQFTKERHGKKRELDLKEIIVDMRIVAENFKLRKKVSGASIYDILEQVFAIKRADSGKLRIQREKLLR